MSTIGSPKLGALAAALATAGALVTVAGSAEATGIISLRVPNGSTHCNYCHTVIPERNIFGAEVEALLELPPEEVWPLLRDLDTDGDLQTNAQELGDPCHVWTMGDIPDRVEDISNPADPLSLSINPEACEEIPSGVGGSGGMDPMGGAGGMPMAEGGSGGAPPLEPEEPEDEASADDEEEDPKTFASAPPKQLCTLGDTPRGEGGAGGALWALALGALDIVLGLRRR